MVVDGDTFRALMRQFPAGVTIVTFDDKGTLGGLAVSSFCSLSMEPPLVLVCIDREVVSHDAIARAGKFGVSVCAADQLLVVKVRLSAETVPSLVLSLETARVTLSEGLAVSRTVKKVCPPDSLVEPLMPET